MRAKSWIDAIPDILQQLKPNFERIYTCRDVQGVYKTNRSGAAIIMGSAGAKIRNGVVTTITGEALYWYTAGCPEAKAYLESVARREALEKRLVQTLEEKRQRSVKVPCRPSDEWTCWKDIPTVTFCSGKLELRYIDREDLLHTLWLMFKAMANEPAEFERLCDPQAAAKPEGFVIGRRAPMSEDDRRAEFPDWKANGIVQKEQHG